VISVPRAFREEPRWWHDEGGRQWLDTIPALAAALPTAARRLRDRLTVLKASDRSAIHRLETP
jgi:hypothetical protein